MPLVPQLLNSSMGHRVYLSAGDPLNPSLRGVYDGTETFAAYLFLGDGLVPSATLSAAWDPDITGNPASVDSPCVLVQINRTDIAGFEPATYRVQVVMGPGTLDITAYLDTIELHSGGSGSGTAGPSYCTYSDIRRIFPLASELVQANPDMTGNLAEMRADARRWLDNQLLARVRRSLESQAERHAPVLSVPPVIPETGCDAGPYWGDSTIPNTTVRDQVEAFRIYLAADALMLDDGFATRITAHYALYLTCDGLPGKASSEESWREIAMRHRNRAARLKTGWVARLDTDGDGVADYVLAY